jgi:hypothetical protein
MTLRSSDMVWSTSLLATILLVANLPSVAAAPINLVGVRSTSTTARILAGERMRAKVTVHPRPLPCVPASGSTPGGCGSVNGSSPTSNGANPTSGSNGANPTSGSNGANPTSGSNGANPTSGSNGANPTSGSNGANPTSGSNGANPTSGSNVTNPTGGAGYSVAGSTATTTTAVGPSAVVVQTLQCTTTRGGDDPGECVPVLGDGERKTNKN